VRVRAGALSNAAQALTAGSTALVDTKTPGRAAPLDVSRTDITKTTSTNSKYRGLVYSNLDIQNGQFVF
jgi:hypothetical protein